MPTTDNTRAKAPISLRKLVMWGLTADSETAITYGEAHAFDKRIMASTDTPSVSEAQLEADDQIADYVTVNDGGELSLDVTDLTAEERVLCYGETISNGTVVANKDDICPYVAVAFMKKRPDGKFNLYKYPKVCFMPQAETGSTLKKGSVNYATTSMKGKYMPTINSGDACYRRYGVDEVTDAAIITSWFTDGSYRAPVSEG